MERPEWILVAHILMDCDCRCIPFGVVQRFAYVDTIPDAEPVAEHLLHETRREYKCPKASIELIELYRNDRWGRRELCNAYSELADEITEDLGEDICG